MRWKQGNKICLKRRNNLKIYNIKMFRALAILTTLSLIVFANIISIPVLAISPPPSVEPSIATTIHALPEPPSGFNPLTATPAELQMYGFPPKPTDEDALLAWEKAVMAAKYWVNPQLCFVDNIVHTEQQPPCDSVDSGNGQGEWAGIAVQSQYNNNVGYNLSTIEFNVPTYQKGLGQGEIASYWTGIGGININQLGNNISNLIVQAGVDTNLTYYPSSNYPTLPLGTNYAAFWEFHNGSNNPTGYIQNLTVSAKDDIYISVSCNQTPPYSAYMWYDDETSGQYAAFLETLPQGYDNCSAEWEYERVAGTEDSISDVNLHNCYLQNDNSTWGDFDAFHWTRCQIGNYNWLGLFVPHYEPTNIGTSSFTIHKQ